MAQDRERDDGSQASDDEQIIRSLARSLEDAFVAYLRDEISFDELTFEMFDTLQAVHAVAAGNYSVEFVEEGEAATEIKEERVQKPARAPAKRPGPRRKR